MTRSGDGPVAKIPFIRSSHKGIVDTVPSIHRMTCLILLSDLQTRELASDTFLPFDS